MGPQRPNRKWVTGGILVGMLVAALESTAATTAMPTVVSSLGGVDYYTWVFSIFLLTATVTLPLWGALSDRFGRKRFYLVGIGLFIVGSTLCGLSRSMLELVLWRAVQGAGAGALQPLAMTIVGEIFTLEERARMQGYFSGVWGVATIVGPLLGGVLAEAGLWRWVFFLGLPFGMVAALIVALCYTETVSSRSDRDPFDVWGLVVVSTTLTCFMGALLTWHEAGWIGDLSWPLLGVAVVGVALSVVAERRTPHAFLPPDLIGNRIILSTSLTAALAGTVHFSVLAFVPLLLQAVHGMDPTQAGSALMPFLLGWVLTTVVGGRLLLVSGYRVTIFLGGCCLVLGCAPLAWAAADLSYAAVCACVASIGAGMGLNNVAALLAVQNAVSRRRMGMATSVHIFFRSAGGAVGLSILGTLLALGVQSPAADGRDLPAWRAPAAHGPALALDAVEAGVLGQSLRTVFTGSLVAALLSLLGSRFVPGGKASDHAVLRDPEPGRARAAATTAEKSTLGMDI